VLTVNGSGLPNQTIEFRFIAKPGVAATVAGGGGTSTAQRVPMAVVARVINGDTIRLRDGRTVRLLQVDAPEASECFGGRATASLRRILRPGVRIGLQADARLGTVDADRRLLRYVLIGRTNVNRMLVQRGAATPHFVGGKRGRLASPLLADARAARSAERGLWKACPDTKLTPTTGANTGPT
jgi:endonuclease YncB( thermonuclease family)